MIPIVIVWTEYTATVNGQVLKLVPCENCATEYVYVLKRENTGTATSFYLGLDAEEQKQLVSNAEETLREYLANDFDPVPCPVCGHYQSYMFPKLMKTGCLWGVVAPVAVLVVGALSAVGVVVRAIEYFGRPGDQTLWRLAGPCTGLGVAGLIGAGLWAAQRARVRNFDPNTEDQQARVERGRKRAVTKSQLEAGEQPRD